MCILFFHKWSKWEYRKEKFTYDYGLVYTLEGIGRRKRDTIREYKTRVCLKCGEKQEIWATERHDGDYIV